MFNAVLDESGAERFVLLHSGVKKIRGKTNFLVEITEVICNLLRILVI